MSNSQVWKRFALLIFWKSNWQDALLGHWILIIKSILTFYEFITEAYASNCRQGAWRSVFIPVRIKTDRQAP